MVKSTQPSVLACCCRKAKFVRLLIVMCQWKANPKLAHVSGQVKINFDD